jgi:hypothetical protein
MLTAGGATPSGSPTAALHVFRKEYVGNEKVRPRSTKE